MSMRQVIASLASAGLFLAIGAGSICAEVYEGDVTITPMAGYHVFDGALDLEDKQSFGLSLGYNITKNWAMEFDARVVPTESEEGEVDVDTLIGTVNALYHLTPDQALVPYLAIGVGGLQYNVSGSDADDEDFVANCGGGVKLAVARNLNLRLDTRYIADFRTDNRGDSQDDDPKVRHQFSAMFGLNFQFGGYSPPPVAGNDSGAKQAVVEPPAPEAPRDSDNDGVLDIADQCVGTALGVRVDASGCAADSDGDGVYDFSDACVNTPAGAKVDASGCPVVARPDETLMLRLAYATGKDQVTPFHYRELERAYAFIQKYPDYDVVIEGHADSKGSGASNLVLSRQRAENVRKVLVAKYGVESGRVLAKGYGENLPVALNSDKDGRAQNRRVVIGILP